MGIQDYPTSKIQNANEKQLQSMLSKFQAEETPIWKLGCFLAYNALAMFTIKQFVRNYVKSKRKQKTAFEKISMSQIKRKYSIENALKKGSIYGLLMGGMYITGLLIVGYFTIPIDLYNKHCEIQGAKASFGIRYNREFQELFLFDRMKQFGCSQQLIKQIKEEIDEQKKRIIKEGGLLESTIRTINRSESKYQQTKQTKQERND